MPSSGSSCAAPSGSWRSTAAPSNVRPTVIAAAAADAAGASLYVVAHPGPDPPHFPSTSVRGDVSPSLQSFFDHVDVVVTVHGFGRDGMFTTLLLGGSNRELAATLRSELTRALPDYEILDDLDAIPRELRGLHPDNPVNVPPHGGVQLELPPRVRGLGPRWADWSGDGLRPTGRRARRHPRRGGPLVDTAPLNVRRLVVLALAAVASAACASGDDDDTLAPLPIEGADDRGAHDGHRAGHRRRPGEPVRRRRAGCPCRRLRPAR